jgi:hypothetical protein
MLYSLSQFALLIHNDAPILIAEGDGGGAAAGVADDDDNCRRFG